MAVLRPLRVLISGLSAVIPSPVLSVPDFPFAPERGSHTIVIEDTIFVDETDFRMEDSDDFYGLAVGKIVGLKYACWIRCDAVNLDDEGKPVTLLATAISESSDAALKPKSTIHWVPSSTSATAEVRVYNNLFTTEEPSDDHWEAELNQESKVVYPNAKVDASIFTMNPVPERHFQVSFVWNERN